MTKYIFNVGDRFGKWTVISSEYKSLSKSRAVHYLCKCACELTERYVNASDLYNNRSKCCNRCSQYKGIKELSGTYLSAIKKGARERNILFDLDIDYLYELYLNQAKKCALSGIELTLCSNYSKKNRHKQNASLDRIDSSKGYIQGNVQWIHKDVNLMKNVYEQDYFINMCKKIAKNHDNK